MDVLVRGVFLIECADKRRLRLVAAERGVSMANLVREAIALFLMTTSGPDADDTLLRARRSIGSLPDERRPEMPQGESLTYGEWWGEAPPDDEREAPEDAAGELDP